MSTLAEAEAAIIDSIVSIAEDGQENQTPDGRMQRMADPDKLAKAAETLQKLNSSRVPAYRTFMVGRPYRD